MAMEPPNQTNPPGTEIAFTDEQRQQFRSAGLWMMLLGGIEVLAGAFLATLVLLSWLGIVPQEAAMDPAFSGTGIHPVTGMLFQIIIAIGIGCWTLWAAAGFRNVAKKNEPTTATVSEAAGRVAQLYEIQVLVILMIVGLVLVRLLV